MMAELLKFAVLPSVRHTHKEHILFSIAVLLSISGMIVYLFIAILLKSMLPNQHLYTKVSTMHLQTFVSSQNKVLHFFVMHVLHFGYFPKQYT